MQHARRPRIVLADDYPRLIDAVQRLLDRSCEIVGIVFCGRDAISAVTALRPDVIVLDLALPDVSGLEACRQIKLSSPATIIVILTAVDDVQVRASALQLGASAFIVKQRAAAELETTIHRLVAEASPAAPLRAGPA